MDALKEAGIPYQVVRYEEFKANQQEYPVQLARSMGFSVGASRCDAAVGSTVEDAHEDGWSNYISNYDEVKRAFDSKGFPTWENVAANHAHPFKSISLN